MKCGHKNKSYLYIVIDFEETHDGTIIESWLRFLRQSYCKGSDYIYKKNKKRNYIEKDDN